MLQNFKNKYDFFCIFIKKHMKLFITFVLSVFYFVGLSQPLIINGVCGEPVHFNDNSKNKSVEINIRNNNQCKKDTFLIVDISIYIVPDRFVILDGNTKEEILDTGWIGCTFPFIPPDQKDNCTNCFAFITPDFKQYMGTNIPADFFFNDGTGNFGNYTGWARVKIPSNLDFFII